MFVSLVYVALRHVLALVLLGVRSWEFKELERILRVFVEHYNTQRPHRALAQLPPEPGRPPPTSTVGEIRRNDRLGGPIREYYRDGA